MTGLNTSPLDQGATGTNGGTATTATAAAITPDVAIGDLVVGCGYWGGSGVSGDVTYTFTDSSGTAITPLGVVTNPNASSADPYDAYVAVWGIAGSGALSQGDSFAAAFSNTSGVKSAAIASFMASGGGGGGTNQPTISIAIDHP